METGFWTVFEGVVNTFSGGALILRFFLGGVRILLPCQAAGAAGAWFRGCRALVSIRF